MKTTKFLFSSLVKASLNSRRVVAVPPSVGSFNTMKEVGLRSWSKIDSNVHVCDVCVAIRKTVNNIHSVIGLSQFRRI